jgi:hypothetical protein
MASNLTVTYPPATGVALPPTILAPFGNTSVSCQNSTYNYPVGYPIVGSQPTSVIDPSEQYFYQQQEYPR